MTRDLQGGRERPGGVAKGVKRWLAGTLGRLGLLAPVTDLYLLLRSGRASGPDGGGTRPRGSASPGPPSEEGLPLPPPRLRFSAAGTADVEWFLVSGRAAAELVREILATRPAGSAGPAILDFGCGCGRVLRHLRGIEGARLHGVDWNAAAVRWCGENLPFARVARGRIAPPLPLPGERFDLVYAFSVFTHFPAALQTAWLAELAARLAPGGLLVLSTHGDAFERELSADERRRYRAGELVLREPGLAGTNVCAAYHPPSALERLLPPGLAVDRHEPQGARGNPPQDLWVLRRDG